MRALQFWSLASQRANISICAHLARAPLLLHDMTECTRQDAAGMQVQVFLFLCHRGKGFLYSFLSPKCPTPRYQQQAA